MATKLESYTLQYCTKVNRQVLERDVTSLLFPLAEVNKSWMNARSDFSEVSSQAACR